MVEQDIYQKKPFFLWAQVVEYLEKMTAFRMCVVSNGLILIE
jgi:hypothetical protein